MCYVPVFPGSASWANYILCGAQCKMKMWGPLFKELSDGNSRALNQEWGPLKHGPFMVPMKPALNTGDCAPQVLGQSLVNVM